MELDSDEPTAATAAVGGRSGATAALARCSTSQNTASSTGHLSPGAVAAITERLALEPELALPSSLYQQSAETQGTLSSHPTHDAVLQYLHRLLAKDPAAFLER